MDKAPAYGAGDSRFDPWQTRQRVYILFLKLIVELDTHR